MQVVKMYHKIMQNQFAYVIYKIFISKFFENHINYNLLKTYQWYKYNENDFFSDEVTLRFDFYYTYQFQFSKPMKNTGKKIHIHKPSQSPPAFYQDLWCGNYQIQRLKHRWFRVPHSSLKIENFRNKSYEIRDGISKRIMFFFLLFSKIIS